MSDFLTVGKLRELLNGMADETRVTLEVRHGAKDDQGVTYLNCLSVQMNTLKWGSEPLPDVNVLILSTEPG